jgi:hypothetical protein
MQVPGAAMQGDDLDDCFSNLNKLLGHAQKQQSEYEMKQRQMN